MYVRISDNRVVAVGGASHKAYLKSLEQPAKPKKKVTKQTKSEE